MQNQVPEALCMIAKFPVDFRNLGTEVPAATRYTVRNTVHTESSAHRHCPCWRDHPSHKAANYSGCMGRYCTPPPRVKFRSEMNTVEMVVNVPASRLTSSFKGQMKHALHHYSKSTLSVEAITQLLLAIIGASALPCPAIPCLAKFQ